MTNAEWVTCADPQSMLATIIGVASERKLRLFAVACCRSVLQNLWTSASAPAVETAERFADRLARAEELENARSAIRAGLELVGGERVYDPAYYACGDQISEDVEWCVFCAADVSTQSLCSSGVDAEAARARSAESNTQATLLHDIFGNPFRPVTYDPRWRTADVRALAEGIYADRAFDRLPILADALMDAGCDNEDILTHCRSEGPHVRGCWALDLALGKE